MVYTRMLRWLLGTVLGVSALLGALGPARLALAAAAPTGSVQSAIGLNLRAGPGLTYRVQLVLKDGTALELVGRSQSSQWLEVRLPDSGLGGWVFAAYVSTRADLTALPVTEGAGGPTDERPPAALAYRLYVAIVDNQATAYLQRYPANADVSLWLGRTAEKTDLRVAQGTTDANGAAQISFAMPAAWADGQPVVEHNLALTAVTADGQFSQTITLVYFQ